MSANQPEQQPLDSNKVEDRRSSRGTSAAAKLIELSIALAGAGSSAPIPGLCSHCWTPRNPHSSTAQFPNVFCSEECEQEFIRAALASLTVEDCIRMQGRLDNLLMGAKEAAAR